MNTYTKSQEWLDQALRWTPGASQTGSKAPGRAGPLGGYPMFMAGGVGARAWDVDGNTYLDMIGGLACVGLGHAQTDVVNAACEALCVGTAMSLPTMDEALAAEQLCLAIQAGYAEQVRWVRTGSEATEAAVRIARCATGRARVLTVSSGYHSWHSWFQAVKPEHPGVPEAMTGLVDGFAYGDVPQRQLDTGEYAAVILEGIPIAGPPNGWGTTELTNYLTRLASAARAAGTLLIFDEVVWGFRLAPGGAAQLSRVEPDLATFGKALGNGIAVGAVVGRESLMRHAGVVSGTFGGDRIGLAAARAVMRVHDAEQVCDHIRGVGAMFARGVNALPADGYYGLRCSGMASHPVLTLTPLNGAGGAFSSVAMSLLLQGMADHGLLFHPAGGNIMHDMNERDIRQAVEATGDALAELNKAYAEHGPEQAVKALRGTPYQQAFARAR